MVYAGVRLSRGVFTRRIQHVQVREGEAVVLFVVREERERGILVLNLCFEHLLVPGDHLLEASRPVDDVREFRRFGHGSPLMNNKKLRPRGAPGNRDCARR